MAHRAGSGNSERGELENHEKLPNMWQRGDPRFRGCLDIAYTITDTFDYSYSPTATERFELAWLPKPLGLARAMRKAARNIELLTISGEPDADEDTCQKSGARCRVSTSSIQYPLEASL